MSKGEGTVYLRGKVWYVKFYRDREQIVISCPGLTEAQARERLKTERRKTNDEFHSPRERRVTIGELFNDLFEHYDAIGRSEVTERVARSYRLHLECYFSEIRAAELTTELQRKYRIIRGKAGAKVATINRELEYVRRAYRVALQQEPPRIKRAPRFLLAKEDNVRTGFVTVPQMAALKIAASSYGLEWRILLELAHWLGWRAGELLNLRVRNFHMEDGHYGVVRLEDNETKSRKSREVPLTESLRAWVAPLLTDREPDARIFSIKNHSVGWEHIATTAGLPGTLFHDLRRSSARTKRAAGIDQSVIMKMQGWESASIFRRYGIVAVDDMERALATQQNYEQKMLAEHASPA
jgi:integrase